MYILLRFLIKAVIDCLFIIIRYPEPCTSNIRAAAAAAQINTSATIDGAADHSINAHTIAESMLSRFLTIELTEDIFIQEFNVFNQKFKVSIDKDYYSQFSNCKLALLVMFEILVKKLGNIEDAGRSLRTMGVTLKDTFTIHIPGESVPNFTSKSILNAIKAFIQSNDSIILNEIYVKVSTVYDGIVTGHSGDKFLKVRAGLQTTDGVLKCRAIPTYFYINGDKGCFFQALAYRLIAHESNRHPRRNQIVERAKLIADQCHIDYDAEVGFQQLRTIEDTLNIRIYACRILDTTKKIDTIYIPSKKGVLSPLYMFILIGSCFYSFTSFSGILEDSVFAKKGGICTLCGELARDFATHSSYCQDRCHACYRPAFECPENLQDAEAQTCSLCHRTFRSAVCYNNHKEVVTSAKLNSNPAHQKKDKNAHFVDNICNRVRKCDKCDDTISTIIHVNNARPHECDKLRCYTCNVSYSPEEVHVCYMKKKSFLKEAKGYGTTVYFDLETQTVDSLFVPVICVCQIVCSMCQNIEPENSDYECNIGEASCGSRTVVFKRTEEDKDVMRMFIKWLLSIHEKKAKSEIVVISHNGARFDNFLTFVALLNLEEAIDVSPPVRKGSSIMKFTLNGNIVFKDSFLFLSCSLSKLPSIFGFTHVVVKGFFPFKKMNEDLSYEGKCPELDFFDTSKMGEDKINEVKEYIEEFNRSGKVYVLFDECVKYCTNDVLVLRLALTKYRQIYINEYEIDPLKSATTIASLCYKVFQSRYLREGTLPIVDRYRSKVYSFMGIEIVSYISFKLKVQARHARTKGGELALKIGGTVCFIDGAFNDSDTNKLILISTHGCYFHACKQCLAAGKCRECWRDGMSPTDIYNKTIADDIRKSAEYVHIVIWEHTYNKMLKGDLEANFKVGYSPIDNKVDFWEDFPGYVDRYQHGIRKKFVSLDDCLAGGRTNAIQLFCDVENDANLRISYKDITSLYPHVQRTCKMPIKMPKKLLAHEAPSPAKLTEGVLNGTFFGIARIDCLAPRTLYIPVLHEVINGKLVFPLCHTCAVEEQTQRCNHSDKKRQLSNTYTSVELELALEHDYTIVNVYETWEYEGDDTIFREYQNEFLRNKIEASGLPEQFSTVEEYCAYVLENDNIQLRPEFVKKDSIIRKMAKDSVNSLWGKLATKSNTRVTKIVDNMGAVLDISFNPNHKVYEILASTNKCAIMYDTLKETQKQMRNSNPCVNVACAAFTTAYARCILYKLLKKAGKNLLYFDTDSLIYYEDKNNPIDGLECGSRIGDLTDELPAFGPNAICVAFVSTGPKSYSLKIKIGEEYIYITKCKGITVVHGKGSDVNFNSMVDIVKNGAVKLTEVERFALGRFDGPFLKTMKKTLQLTYNKRYLNRKDWTTTPWGYHDS